MDDISAIDTAKTDHEDTGQKEGLITVGKPRVSAQDLLN